MGRNLNTVIAEALGVPIENLVQLDLRLRPGMPPVVEAQYRHVMRENVVESVRHLRLSAADVPSTFAETFEAALKGNLV